MGISIKLENQLYFFFHLTLYDAGDRAIWRRFIVHFFVCLNFCLSYTKK